MLTIDDTNTILEKWGKTGFWYELDLSKIDWTSEVNYDFFNLSYDNGNHIIKINNSLNVYPMYVKNMDGEYQDWVTLTATSDKQYTIFSTGGYNLIMGWYITTETIPDFNSGIIRNRNNGLILPVSPTQIPIINGEFDNKFYIDIVGTNISYYTIDSEIVQKYSDDIGDYLILPSAEDHIIGTYGNGQDFPLFKVTSREFKTIPTLSISSLYKGTPQEVKLYNEDTEEYITEFQAYYQGRKLKDNIVTLPYDCDDIIDIVVDILDPAYPPSRVKLKAPTTLYTATSQAEVETAIEQGIRTLQVVNNNTAVSLNEITLDNITIINSKLTIYESTLTNTRIINTRYTDKNHNTFNNVEIKNTTIEGQIEISFKPSSYNNCQILDSTLESIEMHYDGTIKDTIITKSLIISDTNVELIGNTFTGMLSDGMGLYTKPYFPAQLYLTGEYTVKNNSFTLSGTWTEPAFNMCVIKSIESFNPSVFIVENTFNLNIVYDTEPTNTFYYNIVDDDKIKAKRLS